MPDTLNPKNFTDQNGVEWRVRRVRKSTKNPTPTADGKKKYSWGIKINWIAVITAPVLSPLGFFGFTPWAVTAQPPMPEPNKVDPK
jgi:hypothetical protein